MDSSRLSTATTQPKPAASQGHHAPPQMPQGNVFIMKEYKDWNDMEADEEDEDDEEEEEEEDEESEDELGRGGKKTPARGRPLSSKKSKSAAETPSGQASGSGSSGPGPKAEKRVKKTKGRVRIKMEYIDNKIRRYTTFSKRKTGIMKKVSNGSVFFRAADWSVE